MARHFYDIFALPEVLYYNSHISGWTSGETYPWPTTGGEDSDYAAVNAGQLKNLFAFDLSTWAPTSGENPLDQDVPGGDGLLDSWEQTIVDADPNDVITDITQVLASDDGSSPSIYWDFDGDGYDNLTEQQQQTDPTDFYNGETPVIVVVPGYGNNQLVSDGYFNPPLEVKITDSQGGPFQNGNVPVRFTVSGPGELTLPGEGGVEPDGSVEPQQALSVTTARNASNEDIATVYFSSAAAGKSTVTVSLEAPGAVNQNMTLQAWLEPGLIARWEMEEPTGTTVFDSAGSDFDATIAGDPHRRTSWDGSYALKFNGTTDYLILGGAEDDGLDFTSGGFTVVFWISTRASTDARILGTGFSNWSNGYYVGLDSSGHVVAGIGSGAENSSVSIRSDSVVVKHSFLDRWHHVAVTFPEIGSSELARIYVDGEAVEMVKTDANTGGAIADAGYALDVSALSGPVAASSEPFTIGAYHDGVNASAHFKGLLDDVRVYDFVLTSAQVMTLTDSDDDGLPDLYEKSFFSDDPQALTFLSGDGINDFDGDGITDLAEYQYVPPSQFSPRSDPTDYYSQLATTIRPVMSIVSGTPQSVDPGAFTDQPLVVKVTAEDGVTPLVNAPVEFRFFPSAGRVSLSPAGDPIAQSVVPRTVAVDVGGSQEAHAEAYFQALSDLGGTVGVAAVTGKSYPTSVSFAISINGLPEPPRNVVVSEQITSDPDDDSETQFVVTWNDNSDNETGFTIQYQLEDGTWADLGAANPNDTSFDVSESQVNSTGFSGTTNTRVLANSAQGSSESEETEPEEPAPRYAVITLGPGMARFLNNETEVAIQENADYVNSVPGKAFVWAQGKKHEIEVEDSLFGVSVHGINADGVVGCMWREEYTNSDGETYDLEYPGYTTFDRDSEEVAEPTKLDLNLEDETADTYLGVSDPGGASPPFLIGDVIYGTFYGDNYWPVEWSPYSGVISGIYDRSKEALDSGVEEPWVANEAGDVLVWVWPETTKIIDKDGKVAFEFDEMESPIDINNDLIGIRENLWWDGTWRSLPPGGDASQITNRTRTDENGKDVPDYQILGVSGIQNPSYNLWEKRDPEGKVSDQYHSYQLQDQLLHDPETFQVLAIRDINDEGLLVGQVQEYSVDDEGNRDEAVGDPVAALLVPMDLAVDADRDGEIRYAGNVTDSDVDESKPDTTSKDESFVFWVNDDKDTKTWADESDGRGAEDIQGVLDNTDWDGQRNNFIDSKRDLEDFTRLWFFAGSQADSINKGKIKLGLKWKSQTGTPKVKIYLSADSAGTLSYLSDHEAAELQSGDQFKNAIAVVQGSEPVILEKEVTDLISTDQPELYFLFEGFGVGKGHLIFTLHAEDGTQIGEGPGVWLDLRRVTDMYQVATATPWDIPDPEGFVPEQPPEVSTSSGPLLPATFEPPHDEVKKAVVWVHGWNVPDRRFLQQTEALCKRMWWQGFKGRLIAFRWHSFKNNADDWAWMENQVYNAIKFFIETAPNGMSYNQIEYRGFKYGKGLKDLIQSKVPQGYSVHLVAHSMGAITSSSGIEQGAAVNKYVIMNSAVGSQMYNPNLSDDPSFPSARPYDVADKGYRGFFATISPPAVSFRNGDDGAVKYAWAINNNTQKPWAGVEQKYYWDSSVNATKFQKRPPQQTNPDRRTVHDIHESMAMASQSRTPAVGVYSGVGGAVDSDVNMAHSDFFGANNQHSPQFDFNIQENVMNFYRQLAGQLDVLEGE
ncbi:MAG: LamG domain-containing protein [Verrucomicrobiota bacterium]